MDSSSNNHKKKKKDYWPAKVFILTFVLAMVFSFFSETTLMGVKLPIAIAALIFIIFVGIIFDIIGIAVTCETVSAYTAMASKKIPGAREAIKLVQSAPTVSNICNDVVGDICGIVSGAMGAAIAANLFVNGKDLIASILVSSLIAAFMVGGKAIGKKIASKHSHHIVFFIGKLFSLFSRRDQYKA